MQISHFYSSDLYTMKLCIKQKTIWIYLVYSQSLRSYSVTDYYISILLLKKLIQWFKKHIVLSDFNLHHLL